MAARQRRLHHGLIVGETLHIMRVMRQNQRWQSTADGVFVEENWLIQSFQKLRWSLLSTDGIGREFDRMDLIRPYVSVIRSEETSGPITGAALGALSKFLSANMFAIDCAHAAAAVAEIADAGTHCRFEATDAGNDELVLVKILEVHLACLSVERGSYLSDTTVWEMIQTCFRIHRQMRPPAYSHLLCDRAKHSLFEMIRMIFSQLSLEAREKLPQTPTAPGAVHASNVQHIEERFGVPCMVKVFGNLIHMGRNSMKRTMASSILNQKQVNLALRLILEALEYGGDVFETDRSLLGLVQDDVCAFLLQNAKSARAKVMTLVVRIFYCIVTHLRAHVKVQTEVILHTIYLGSADAPFAIRELILESLHDFARLPWFFRELYVNYDCCPRANDLFEDVVSFLCASANPTAGPINSNHVAAARCLTTALQMLGVVEDADSDVDEEHLREEKRQKFILQGCIAQFNKKPKLGIAALVKADLMESYDDAKSLARLLSQTPGVDKAVLGDFIGSNKAFQCKVRDAFIAFFDFRGKTVVEALRVCLEGFRLPVEAQQIDRVVQSFSGQYYSQNSRDFASPDAIHVLTFALIMLNTDAHNDGIKPAQKMTLGQFMRNLRDVNDGASFDQDFLEGMYLSIVSDELKISKMGPGGDVSKSLWIDMLNRAHTTWGRQYSRYCKSTFDSDMFERTWRTALTSATDLFGLTEIERVATLAMSLLDTVGNLACKYQLSEVVDEIVAFGCQASGLLSMTSGLGQALLALGTHGSKEQLSLRILFRQPLSEHMSGSWGIWITVLFHLLRLDVLPPSFSHLDDFSNGNNTHRQRLLSFDDFVNKPVSLQSLFSSVQSFLMSSHEQLDVDIATDKLAVARKDAQVFVEQLRIDDLIAGTMFIPIEALDGLIRALTSATRVESATGVAQTPVHGANEEMFLESFPKFERDVALVGKQMAFYLQLLTNVVIRNRDRAQLFWPQIITHLRRLLESQMVRALEFEGKESPLAGSSRDAASTPPTPSSTLVLDVNEFCLAEAASVAALQLCIKLVPLDSPDLPVLALLDTCLQLDVLGHRNPRIGRQIVCGLLSMFQVNPRCIRHLNGWNTVYELLGLAASSSQTFAPGFECVALLITDSGTPGVSFETIARVIQVIVGYAQSKLGSVTDRLRAVDYLAVLHGRLHSLKHLPRTMTVDEDDDTDDVKVTVERSDVPHAAVQVDIIGNGATVSAQQPIARIAEVRLLILNGLRVVICTSDKFSLREHSLATMQEILFSANAKAFDGGVWSDIFTKVVVPMTRSLGAARSSSHYLSKCRCAVTSFSCRLFLTYLSVMLLLPVDLFLSIWSGLLQSLASFVDLETSQSASNSLLTETVLESLKNTLRVMNACISGDAPEGFEERLWEATWAILDPICPQLRDVFAPEEDSGEPSPAAGKSPKQMPTSTNSASSSRADDFEQEQDKLQQEVIVTNTVEPI